MRNINDINKINKKSYTTNTLGKIGAEIELGGI